MKTIERVSVVQQLADNLTEFIMSDEIAVGAKMPTEMTLCQQNGVGRGTVREALRILQSNGLIEMRPNRGAFVTSKQIVHPGEDSEWFRNNEVQVRDIVEMRLAVEPLAARLMATRASDENLAHLERIHARFLKAAEQGDNVASAKHDARFHAYIVEKSGNYMMQVLSNKLNTMIEQYCKHTFTISGHINNAIEPHTKITKAILRRDPNQSEEAMRQHLMLVLDTLNDVYE